MENEIDSMKAGLIEEISYHLEEIDKLENGSKEQSTMVQDLKELVLLLDTLNKTDQSKLKDKELIDLERDKMKIGWKRAAFEMAKVTVPTIVSIVAYDIFQKRVLDFEEHGRLTSTASHELHLPRFFK